MELSTTAQAVFGNNNWYTRINGTEPQYFTIRDWPIQRGTSFTMDDVHTAGDVAVRAGAAAAPSLMGAAPGGLSPRPSHP